MKVREHRFCEELGVHLGEHSHKALEVYELGR